jgi:hypothetical protein
VRQPPLPHPLQAHEADEAWRFNKIHDYRAVKQEQVLSERLAGREAA